MRNYFFLFFLSAALIFSSCQNMTKTQKGAAVGTATGGAIGTVIGSATGNTAAGAVIGATVGGVAGAIIGKQMDKQAKQIQNEVPNAEVIHNEGDHTITVNFSSAVLFATDKSDLTETSKATVRDLAKILKAYPDTDLQIQGHTDSQGADDYNMKLSEKRAGSVAEYLRAQAIASSRIVTKGFGETQPVATNATPEGRAQNRRVTFIITPNEKMIQDAQKQAN